MEKGKPKEKSVRSYLRSILDSSMENVKPNRCLLGIDDGQSTSIGQRLHVIEDQENGEQGLLFISN